MIDMFLYEFMIDTDIKTETYILLIFSSQRIGLQ